MSNVMLPRSEMEGGMGNMCSVPLFPIPLCSFLHLHIRMHILALHVTFTCISMCGRWNEP